LGSAGSKMVATEEKLVPHQAQKGGPRKVKTAWSIENGRLEGHEGERKRRTGEKSFTGPGGKRGERGPTRRREVEWKKVVTIF